MKVFLQYWNAYASQEEAKDISKNQWSSTSVSSGIISSALHGLANLLSGGKQGPFSIEDVSNGLIRIRGNINFNGLRYALLAIENEKQYHDSSVARDLMDCAREAFVLCVLPSPAITVWPLANESVQTGAGNVIPLYPVDIDALASEKVTIFDLITYKLYRRLVLGKPDPATQFDSKLAKDFFSSMYSDTDGFEDIDALISETPDKITDWVDHPLCARICKALDDKRGCLMIGPSSSGKSILALQVGRSYALRGESVAYLNLNPGENNVKEFFDLLFSAPGDDIYSLIILDDLQSSPSLAKFFLAAISAAIRCSTKTLPAVLAISWVDFSREAAVWFEDCLPITVRPFQIKQKLMSKYRHNLSEEILCQVGETFGDDIFLLHQSLKQSSQQKRLAQPGNLAQSIWNKRTLGIDVNESEVIRVALIVGSLGRFDLSIPVKFLCHEADTSQTTIDCLINSKLLRWHQNNISMGHRSLCGLLSDWLGQNNGWEKLSEIGRPTKTNAVVLDYFHSLGSLFAVGVLDTLHACSGFKDRPKLNDRAAALVEIWDAFNAVLERMEHQQSIDSTWGNTPSSAMFAVKTFNEIGKSEFAKKSLEFLRKHWKINKRRLEVNLAGLSTQYDFENIRLAMEKEDTEKTPKKGMSAKDVNIDRFHQTWILGLILCAEAAVNSSQQNKLADLVEAQQLDNGAFYPERVPWSTARVLLGLAACGHTLNTSTAVKRAVDWLIKDIKKGGACDNGIWHSGTGTWNSTLETTGMVLSALAAVGYDCSNTSLNTATKYLLSQRNHWTAPKERLDGALAIQSFLDTGGAWEEVVSEAQSLSRWAKSESLWQAATRSAKDSLKQSCEVAQSASHLISIGWTAIQSDLPAFLDALAITNLFQDNDLTQTPEAIPDEYVSQEAMLAADPEFATLCNIKSISLSDYKVVGDYFRYEERIRNKLIDWHRKIKNPLVKPTEEKENFLIWAAPGSGKTFFIKQIAKNLAKTVNYVEINFAKVSHDEFSSQLNSIKTSSDPTLCLFDEVDKRADIEWLCEESFPLLELNMQQNHTIVFVLIGSTAHGLEGMTRDMAKRKAGNDLLDRIPHENRFEIPGVDLNDRIIIAISQIFSAAKTKNLGINGIERFALYYLLKNEGLSTPRQLDSRISKAIRQLSPDDDRFKYDDLFGRGDHQNQQFWAENVTVATDLSDIYVQVKE